MREEQLPKGWQWKKLGDISTVIRGASPRPAGDPKYFGGIIPWITVGELTKDHSKFLTNVGSFVTEKGKEKSRFIEKGTLLLTNSGATLGVPKITQLSGCINDGSVALLDLVEITKNYVYWFLKSQTRTLRLINQGAAQPNLNTTIVKNLELIVPPLPVQQQIVACIEELFSELDAGVQELQTALARLKTYRQAVLHHYLNNPDWERVKLGEVAEGIDPQPSHRTPPVKVDGIPYVGYKDINLTKNCIDFDSARKVDQTVLEEHLQRYKLTTVS